MDFILRESPSYVNVPLLQADIIACSTSSIPHPILLQNLLCALYKLPAPLPQALLSSRTVNFLQHRLPNTLPRLRSRLLATRLRNQLIQQIPLHGHDSASAIPRHRTPGPLRIRVVSELPPPATVRAHQHGSKPRLLRRNTDFRHLCLQPRHRGHGERYYPGARIYGQLGKAGAEEGTENGGTEEL